jgi:hypothetical protein
VQLFAGGRRRVGRHRALLGFGVSCHDKTSPGWWAGYGCVV